MCMRDAGYELLWPISAYTESCYGIRKSPSLDSFMTGRDPCAWTDPDLLYYRGAVC
jgi:hypothetical protein